MESNYPNLSKLFEDSKSVLISFFSAFILDIVIFGRENRQLEIALIFVVIFCIIVIVDNFFKKIIQWVKKKTSSSYHFYYDYILIEISNIIYILIIYLLFRILLLLLTFEWQNNNLNTSGKNCYYLLFIFLETFCNLYVLFLTTISIFASSRILNKENASSNNN